MSMFDTATRSELMAEFDYAEELRAERIARADPGPEEPRSRPPDEGCPVCGDEGGDETPGRSGRCPMCLRAPTGYRRTSAGLTCTCQQCDGGGEVHWNPSHVNDPQDVMTARCPRCRGEGVEP